MMFRTDYINKALIDQEGHLRLPHNKQEALRRLTNQNWHSLGSIHDLPSYVTAVLKVYNEEQRIEVEKFFMRHLQESFTNSDKENLTPLLYDFDFTRDQILVFLDLLGILTTCEDRGWLEQFRTEIFQ